MLSPSQIVLEYVCPACGMIMGNIMFSAPYWDVRKATEEGRLGDLNPTPWAVMLGNCCGWIVYSFLVHNLFIFFANAPGFLLSVWLNLQAIKLQYGDFRSTQMRRSIISALEQSQRPLVAPPLPSSSSPRAQRVDATSLLVDDIDSSKDQCDDGDDLDKADNDLDNDSDEGYKKTVQVLQSSPPQPASTSAAAALDFAKIVWNVTAQNTRAPVAHERIVLFMVVLWLLVISVISYFSETLSPKTSQLTVGIIVNLNLVFFYGAPLSTIMTVLHTRTSASIHIPTMITSTVNGMFWCAFGIAVMDMFVAVPNGLGAVLGGVQMILCVLFPRRPKDIHRDTTNGTMELSDHVVSNNDNNTGNSNNASTRPVENGLTPSSV